MFLKEYQKLRELGKGAFAKVYKVRHKELGYIRAIRVLNEIVSDKNDECYQKFLTECKILLRLGNGGHPNIVHIYQPRLLQNHALVEMDYVDGCDVDDYLKLQNKFIAIDEVMRFMENISSALAYCHVDIYQFCMDREIDNLQDDPEDGRKVLIDEPTRLRLIEKYGITHNDIHSKNIMRKNLDGSFVLLDFGLSIQDGTIVKSSTRRGGAPEYKAPEKWENEGIISPGTDIYSFGILLYEILTGQVPFPYDSKITQQRAEYEIAEQHLKATPPAIEPLRCTTYETAFPGKNYIKDYPDWLEQVIMKCLEKNPENRYANGKELYEEIKPLIATFNQSDSREIYRLRERIKELETQKPLEIEKIVTGEKIVHKNNPLRVVFYMVFLLISAMVFIDYIGQPKDIIDTDKSQVQILSGDDEVIVPKVTTSTTDQASITERDRLKKEIIAFQTEINRLKSLSNSDNNAEVQRLATEIDKLKKEKTQLNLTINKKNNEIQGLRTTIDELLKKK